MVNFRLFIIVLLAYYVVVFLFLLPKTETTFIYLITHSALILSFLFLRHNLINIVILYSIFFIIYIVVGVYLSDFWFTAPFMEQDTKFIVNAVVEGRSNLNPFKNWSNGGFYLSVIHLLGYLNLDIVQSGLLINGIAGLIIILVLYKSNIFGLSIGRSASIILMINPNFWVYSHIILKDFWMQLFILLFFVISPSGKSLWTGLKNFVLGSIYFMNERVFLIPFLALSHIGHRGFLLVLVLIGFYLSLNLNSEIIETVMYTFKLFNSGINQASFMDQFPFSIIKFTLTPLPGSSTINFPAKTLSNLHWPTTLLGLLGFLFLIFKIRNARLYALLIMFILVGAYAPGYDRFRLMFEPIFAIGCAFVLTKLRRQVED